MQVTIASKSALEAAGLLGDFQSWAARQASPAGHLPGKTREASSNGQDIVIEWQNGKGRWVLPSKFLAQNVKPVAQSASVGSVASEAKSKIAAIGSKAVEKAKDVGGHLYQQNKDAAIIAAKVEAGKAVNEKLIDVLASTSPALAPLLEGPFGKLIVANVVNGIAKVYPDNDKVNAAAECLTLAAYIDGANDLGIKDKLLSVFDGIKFPQFAAKAED